RMRTPSSALPACPHGFEDGLGRPLFAAGFARLRTKALAFFLAVTLAGFDFTALPVLFRAAALVFVFARMVIPFLRRFYFVRTTLCGLRLPMRPLSVPAAGSITALMRVGLPESMAALTARFNSSGVVALAPTPPNASIILS